MKAEIIYVIAESFDSSPCKIGVSTVGGLQNRLISLQIGYPYPLQIIGYEESDNAFAIEQNVHLQLSDTRLNGEWFDTPANEALKIIRQTILEGIGLLDKPILGPTQLGRVLKTRRQQLGFTQAEMALNIDTSRRWVSAIEKGKDGSQLWLVLKLLEELGLEIRLGEKDGS